MSRKTSTYAAAHGEQKVEIYEDHRNGKAVIWIHPGIIHREDATYDRAKPVMIRFGDLESLESLLNILQKALDQRALDTRRWTPEPEGSEA